MCCGRLQECAASPSIACINSSEPKGDEAVAQATPVAQPATIDSDNDSSDTVSVSSERSLEVRQYKWKILTERYRSAKYLAAKRKSTAKHSQTSSVIPRMFVGRMGRYSSIGQYCRIEVTLEKSGSTNLQFVCKGLPTASAGSHPNMQPQKYRQYLASTTQLCTCATRAQC